MEQEFNLNELNASTNSTLDYIQTEDVSKGQEIRKLSNNVTTQKKTLKLTGTQNKKISDFAELRPVTASSSMIRLENEIEKSLLEASDSIISETSLNNSDFVKKII